MPTLKTKPVLAAIELWETKNSSLALTKAFYGDYSSFFQGRLGKPLDEGEGLAGQVLRDKTVQLWPDLANERGFSGAKETQDPINMAIGIPIMPKGQVKTVVLFFLSVHNASSVIELWKPNALGVLSLAQGIYKNVPNFQAVSQSQKFSVLEGLPGRVFDEKMVFLFPTLDAQSGFIRAKAAQEAGLEASIGLPILEADNAKAALLLFTKSNAPLVLSMQLWRKDGKMIECLQAYYAEEPKLSRKQKASFDGLIKTLVADVHREATPILSFGFTTEVEFVLGIPIFNKNKITTVVVFIN